MNGNQRIETCQKCGGAILIGGGTWGYGGQLCYCPAVVQNPTQFQQSYQSLDFQMVSLLTEIRNLLQEIKNNGTI